MKSFESSFEDRVEAESNKPVEIQSDDISLKLEDVTSFLSTTNLLDPNDSFIDINAYKPDSKYLEVVFIDKKDSSEIKQLIEIQKDGKILFFEKADSGEKVSGTMGGEENGGVYKGIDQITTDYSVYKWGESNPNDSITGLIRSQIEGNEELKRMLKNPINTIEGSLTPRNVNKKQEENQFIPTRPVAPLQEKEWSNEDEDFFEKKLSEI